MLYFTEGLKAPNRCFRTLLWLLAMVVGNGDVYLHNPRGSNNRINESTRERANNNRLFDSQNNNRGGYNVGGLQYYAGSVLRIEWTNQHSCHGPNNNCDIILQYMCSSQLRDGTTTKIVPIKDTECQNNDCSTDNSHGLNEDHLHYQHCQSRERNKGLFTADQNLKGQSSLYTRQNPHGERFGLECPEERDYYPYWMPSPWKDIAVLTNNVSRCEYYRRESENVKPRYWCELPAEILTEIIQRRIVVPISETECQSFTYPLNDPLGTGGVWKKQASHGLAPPECRETEYTRDNHLGDTVLGRNPSYEWIVPDINEKKCVLRIRYNISTKDYDGWDPSVNSSLNNLEGSMVLKTTELDNEQKQNRGYLLKNNPQINIFPDLDIDLNLAINTSQFGRVFEDRSHVLSIHKRPQQIPRSRKIHNYNVNGKRGNIVQVYPAVEYDFAPRTLELSKKDYIHIQWTGSNSNPLDNDGQGLPGTDRSNLVPLENAWFGKVDDLTVGHWGSNYPDNVSNGSFMGLSVKELHSLAFLDGSGDLSQLNDPGTYFNLGLKKMEVVGTFNFMCTRNNFFSERSQKGQVIVSEAQVMERKLGWSGGNISVGSNFIKIKEAELASLTNLRVESWNEDSLKSNPHFSKYQERLTKDLVSDILVIYPEDNLTAENKTVTVSLKIQNLLAEDVNVYRSTMSDFSLWQRIPTVMSGKTAVFTTNRGGVYVVRTQRNNSGVAAIVILILALVILTVGIVLYFYNNQLKWKALLGVISRTKRSIQDEI